MFRGELGRRVGVAAVGIPLGVAIVYLGEWVLGILLAGIAALGAAELCRLGERLGVRAFTLPSAAGAALFVLIATALPEPARASVWLWATALLLLLVSAAAAIWARGVERRPTASTALTVIAAMYPGGTLAYGLFLRHMPQAGGSGAAGAESAAAQTANVAADPLVGTALLLFPVALTWLNDSCAYFAGTAWGRRRLIPTVSPNKTVVGAVAGVVGGTIAGAFVAAILLDRLLGLTGGLWWGALAGAAIAVIAQVGDLVESLMKRDAGVKDSGRLFPGHGGVLDRFDALFLTIPFAYGWFAVMLRLADGGAPWP